MEIVNLAWIVERFYFLIPLVVALSIHEWAHAQAAFLLGDDTSQRLGRLTLNPFVHVDPVGTVLLPFLGVPFGWAKPVPFNPLRFRSSITVRYGSLIVAIAGPISNIVQAGIAYVIIALVPNLGLSQSFELQVFQLLQYYFILNLLLAVFNLIPIPPLDGSFIAEALMPSVLRPIWNVFASCGYYLLMLIILLPYFLGVSPFAALIRHFAKLIKS